MAIIIHHGCKFTMNRGMQMEFERMAGPRLMVWFRLWRYGTYLRPTATGCVNAEKITALGKHQPDRLLSFTDRSHINNPPKLLRNGNFLERAVERHSANLYFSFASSPHQITNLGGGVFETFLADKFGLNRMALLPRFCAGNTDKLCRNALPGIPPHVLQPRLTAGPHMYAEPWAEGASVMAAGKHSYCFP